MSMNNNTFVHLYSKVVHSKTAAMDFFHAWKRMIVSTKSRTGIVEFTMRNNDVHVFLSDISYPQWCCGRTYYMDGILYHGEYPYNRPIQKEKNMQNVYVVTKDGWTEGYGAEIYLLGVFSDKNVAEKVATENNADVTEIEPNKAFPLKRGDHWWESDYNDYHLGGYCE